MRPFKKNDLKVAFSIPILINIYNRPYLTDKVFQVIRHVKPLRLFISADGPKSNGLNDFEICKITREIVKKNIDWKCDTYFLYRDVNVGCRNSVSSAIDWFFYYVDEGIIFEDDTLPDPSFFRFAEVLLKRYRNKPEVMHISGNNHQHGRIRGDGAYYASRFAHSWGWATWRRAWKLYEREMTGFPEDWESIAARCDLSTPIKAWWKMALENTRSGVVTTWDFQWHYTIMKNNGLCLIPNQNLVCNIGVGANATHMKQKDVASTIKLSSLKRFDAPSNLLINNEADSFDFTYSVTNNSPPRRTPVEYFQEWIFRRKFTM
jgi:hypothetical protein